MSKVDIKTIDGMIAWMKKEDHADEYIWVKEDDIGGFPCFKIIPKPKKDQTKKEITDGNTTEHTDR